MIYIYPYTDNTHCIYKLYIYICCMRILIDIPDPELEKLKAKAVKKRQSRKSYIESICIEDAKKPIK